MPARVPRERCSHVVSNRSPPKRVTSFLVKAVGIACLCRPRRMSSPSGTAESPRATRARREVVHDLEGNVLHGHNDQLSNPFHRV